MRLRLPRWKRRTAIPSGRHAQGPAPLARAGAGASLVAGVMWDAERRPDSAGHDVRPDPAAPADAPNGPVARGSAVALGFTDGASVELDADHPLAAPLHAAAAAVLAPRQPS
jgi:hypothetical protein